MPRSCTLALAIGANAVVFGVLNALILRPLNVPRSAKSLRDRARSRQGCAGSLIPIISICAIATAASTALTALTSFPVGLDTGKNPAQVMGYEVSGNYFDALGIQPFLGRFFHGADEHGPNSAPYVVISYAYWHSHFQDDRNVVGRVVRLNKHPFTILGRGAAAISTERCCFFIPDFWAPVVNQEQIRQAQMF